MDEFISEHGKPKSIVYLPESERELTVILRRERFKRNYHAKPGNIKEYIDGLKKGTVRGRLKEAQTAAVSPPRAPTHKKEPER